MPVLARDLLREQTGTRDDDVNLTAASPEDFLVNLGSVTSSILQDIKKILSQRISNRVAAMSHKTFVRHIEGSERGYLQCGN